MLFEKGNRGLPSVNIFDVKFYFILEIKECHDCCKNESPHQPQFHQCILCLIFITLCFSRPGSPITRLIHLVGISVYQFSRCGRRIIIESAQALVWCQPHHSSVIGCRSRCPLTTLIWWAIRLRSTFDFWHLVPLNSSCSFATHTELCVWQFKVVDEWFLRGETIERIFHKWLSQS